MRISKKSAVVIMHFLFCFGGGSLCLSQSIAVKGKVQDAADKNPLGEVIILSKQTGKEVFSGPDGNFAIPLPIFSADTIQLIKPSYKTLKIVLEASREDVDLGVLLLELDVEEIQHAGQLLLIEDLQDSEQEGQLNAGFLGASRDLLHRRAAFDFGPAFYRIRGYDSRSRIVLINGMQMNGILRGRPQWSQWGGLNDVFRYQDISAGIGASSWHFGDLLGTTYIDTRPSAIRPGLRITGSLSNRTYAGRLMATYNDPAADQGFGYTVSGSARRGAEGFIDGTSYEAYSVFAGSELKINSRNSLSAAFILSFNKRGRSAAITEEVFKLIGRSYNPYWGIQGSRARNSRVRTIREPIIILNYQNQGKDSFWAIGLSYQWGTQAQSRLSYFNAPNPLPDYYRYLPSYSINSPIGADFISAEASSLAFKNQPQINWNHIYQANRSLSTQGRASYLLSSDVSEATTFRGRIHFSTKLGSFFTAEAGINFYDAKVNFYNRLDDLLGAVFHIDEDPFSKTANNLDSEGERKQGDKIGYSYTIRTQNMEAFFQLNYARKKWKSFCGIKYYERSFVREGIFRNGRYPDRSKGYGERVSFAGPGIKAGISFTFDQRNQMEWNGTYYYRPPVLANIYANPREQYEVVPDIEDEQILSSEINYRFVWPDLKGRVSAYYTRIRRSTEVSFFFVDTSLGSDFVQQQITGMDRLHAGLEWAVTYNPNSTVTLSLAGSYSKFLFANNPSLTISFDTEGEDLINISGKADLGRASLKDLKTSSGPSQAISLGIEYRDPAYWWVATTINRLSDSYIHISPLNRTQSFNNIPEKEMVPEGVEDRLLKQRPLEVVYLMHINAGKSWKIGDSYLSLFLNISNLLDTTFKSGGFEQRRNGNITSLYQDQLSGNPSFGPKYWFGFGRTYFLNLSISL